MVARRLQDGGFGTLLFDLLTVREETLDASHAQPSLRHRLPGRPAGLGHAVGGDATADADPAASGTSARAPARRPHSWPRRGTPGLVRRDRLAAAAGRTWPGRNLRQLRAPTLLIVGGADSTVIRLNQAALAQLSCDAKELKIVPGAIHLFEEPGALERVADLAGRWFTRYLQPEPRVRVGAGWV